MVYSYSFLEQEEISDKFREEIKKYLDTNPDSINKNKVTLKKIVVENIGRIIKEISKNVINDEFYRSFEYWAEYTFVKTTVWSYETLTETLLYLYTIFYDFTNDFNLSKFILEIEATELTKQKRILETILRRIDDTKQNPKFDMIALQNIQKICWWFAFEVEESRINQTAVVEMPKIYERYETIRKEISETINKKYSKSDINIAEVNAKLKELFDRDKCEWFSTEIEGDTETTKELMFIIPLEKNNEKEIARVVKKDINQYVNEAVKEILLPLRFSFDEYSINNLCEEIKKYDNIDYSNYDVSKDWGITKDVKEKDSFIEYLELIRSIEFIDDRIIYPKYYVKKEDLKIQAEVISVLPENLEGEELGDFVERFKSFGGIYRYEGSLINKSTLMVIVSNSYRKYKVIMKLKSKLKKDSGFRLEVSPMSIEM